MPHLARFFSMQTHYHFCIALKKKMQFKSISIVANTITIGNIPFRSIKQIGTMAILRYTVSLLRGKKQQKEIYFPFFLNVCTLDLIFYVFWQVST